MIPCYEEQEKIGSYLHSLDNLITLHQRKCEETKTLKKYMLQRCFHKMVIQFQKLDFPGLLKIGNSVSLGDVFEQTAKFC